VKCDFGTSGVKTIPCEAAAVRPRQLPRGQSHHVQAVGCGAQLRRHWSPSVTAQTITARCMGRKSRGQAGGRSTRPCSHHSTPACTRLTPSHTAVLCRVSPSGRTPGSAWHITQHGTHSSERTSRDRYALDPGMMLAWCVTRLLKPTGTLPRGVWEPPHQHRRRKRAVEDLRAAPARQQVQSNSWEMVTSPKEL
jgi:hypothetical protein